MGPLTHRIMLSFSQASWSIREVCKALLFIPVFPSCFAGRFASFVSGYPGGGSPRPCHKEQDETAPAFS